MGVTCCKSDCYVLFKSTPNQYVVSVLRVCFTWHKRVSKGGCIHLKETHTRQGSERISGLDILYMLGLV